MGRKVTGASREGFWSFFLVHLDLLISVCRVERVCPITDKMIIVALQELII